MEEKKTLSNEELEEVSGGKYPGDSMGQYGLSDYVDRYAVLAGHTYFFAKASYLQANVFKGYVTKTCECSNFLFGTTRTHFINVLAHWGVEGSACQTYECEAGPWVAYKTYNGVSAE